MEKKPRYVWYKGTRYHLNRGYYKTTCGLHRRIWEDHFGEIPRDHHIHHKNGDSTDNCIENLECIHKSKHHKMHFDAQKQVKAMHSRDSRLKALEWYRSDEGRKVQGLAGKKQWADRRPVERDCLICNTKFKTKNLNGTKYCSQKCRSRSQALKERVSRNCVICGKEFTTRNNSQMGKTCSQFCKGRLISKTKMENANDFISTT